MKKDKIIVVSLMLFCVICFIAIAMYFLFLQNNNAESTDEQQIAAIIQVAGLAKAGETDASALQTIFHRRVIVRQVDLDSGMLLSSNPSQDTLTACVTLPADMDPAQIRRSCKTGKVYFVHKNNKIQQVILPIYGKGAKSMMRAFIALAPDGRTVKNLLYYQHNETPLLGARVEDPTWLHQWTGKKLLNDQAQPALKVVQKGANPQDIYTVDGITGATMTSVGVEKSVNFWMGERGYGPFLRRLERFSSILD